MVSLTSPVPTRISAKSNPIKFNTNNNNKYPIKTNYYLRRKLPSIRLINFKSIRKLLQNGSEIVPKIKLSDFYGTCGGPAPPPPPPPTPHPRNTVLSCLRWHVEVSFYGIVEMRVENRVENQLACDYLWTTRAKVALPMSTTFQHEIDIKLEDEWNPRQKGSAHSFLF